MAPFSVFMPSSSPMSFKGVPLKMDVVATEGNVAASPARAPAGRRSSRYIEPAVDVQQREKICKEAIRVLSRRRKEFDAIAVRGLSGALVAPIVSARLKIPIVAVRKTAHTSHATVDVEAGIRKGRYIVFDDFMSSGETVDAIIRGVTRNHPELTPVACYFYRDDKLHDDNAYSVTTCGGTTLPLWSRRADFDYGANVLRGYRLKEAA